MKVACSAELLAVHSNVRMRWYAAAAHPAVCISSRGSSGYVAAPQALRETGVPPTAGQASMDQANAQVQFAGWVSAAAASPIDLGLQLLLKARSRA